jgi:hypothetical protein
MHWPPLPPGNNPSTHISVRGWVDPRAIVWPEGMCQWINPMTLLGIDPATFWFVAQYLNHCVTTCPRYYSKWLNMIKMKWVMGKQVVGMNSTFYGKWTSNSISEEISWTDNNLLTVQDKSLSEPMRQEFELIKPGVHIFRHWTYLNNLCNCSLYHDSSYCV